MILSELILCSTSLQHDDQGFCGTRLAEVLQALTLITIMVDLASSCGSTTDPQECTLSYSKGTLVIPNVDCSLCIKTNHRSIAHLVKNVSAS